MRTQQKSHLAKSITVNVYNRLNIELFHLLFRSFKPPRIGFESFKPTAFGKTKQRSAKTTLNVIALEFKTNRVTSNIIPEK